MFDDVGGAGEGGVGRLFISFDLDEADIVRAIVPHQGCAGFYCIAGRNDGRQRLVVDVNKLGGVGRLVIRLRDDEGDIVADHSHAILGQCRIARPVAGHAIAPLQAARHRKVAKSRRLVVGARQDREDPGRRFGP